MATIIHDVAEMQSAARALRSSGKRISLVPTMGALHEGHLSLIRLARQHADAVVTTIFVNPAQFRPGEDFERYPRNFPSDCSLAEGAGTDYLFAPEARAIYPDGYLTFVDVERLSGVLEGRSRPGHFRGVATVVAKLFHIAQPHVAVFGQKDAQQVLLVRRMIQDLNFDVQLVVAPIVREPDGLAMSSRNAYLTPEERSQAPLLYEALCLGEKKIRDGERASAAIVAAVASLIRARSGGRVDYISLADAVTLEELPAIAPGHRILLSLAVWFGSTRLIDNLLITV